MKYTVVRVAWAMWLQRLHCLYIPVSEVFDDRDAAYALMEKMNDESKGFPYSVKIEYADDQG